MTIRRCIIILTLSLLTILSAHAERPAASVSVDSILDIAIALSKEHRFEKSFDELNAFKRLAEQEGNDEMLYRYHLNWGVNLAMMSAYDDALRSFSAAYKIAVDKLDLRHETGVLNDIAGVFMLMGNNRQANEYYKKNYRIAEELKDSNMIAGTAMNIALTALNLGDGRECMKYMRVSETFVKDGTTEWYVFMLLKLSYLIFEKDNDQVISLSCKELKRDLPHDVRRNIRCKLSSAYIANGQYKSAIDTLSKALTAEVDEVDRIPIYNLMIQALRKSNNYELALRYTDSLMIAKDSLQSRRNQDVYESNSIRLDLLRKDKETAEIKARENRNKILLCLSILIFVLLVWVLVNSVKHARQKNEQQRQELSLSRQNEELLKNRLRQKDAETLLKQKELQLEIEMKNRELMSKAMSMAKKNELVQEIINGLTEDVKIGHNSQLGEIIRKLRSQLSENKEWENFNIYFQQTNNDFIIKLKNRHPGLTANEVRFISLLYVGLSNKEISSLLSITSEYCKKKRKAIALKMGLSSPRELSGYLSMIQQSDDGVMVE